MTNGEENDVFAGSPLSENTATVVVGVPPPNT